MLPSFYQPTGTNASYLGAGFLLVLQTVEIQVMMVTPILAVMSGRLPFQYTSFC